MSSIRVTDFGAVGDGKTMNTRAFALALEAIRKNGGGELVVPAGEFLSGGIRLVDNLTLRLEKGAVLKASGNIADHYHDARYENLWLDDYFIYALGVRNLKIIGDGVIDGNGRGYWEDVYRCGIPFGELPENLAVIHYNVLKAKDRGRPVMLYLEDCRDIEIRDITLRNAACYTVWSVSSRDLRIDHVLIRNLRYGPNTDALDIDCSQNVLVTDCDIEAGDDCIAVKSDPNRFGRMDACENIRVENCRLSSTTCAIRIGYEGDAPIRDLTFRNLDIRDSRHGIDILSVAPNCKLRIDHGTPMDHFTFENFRMDNVGQAFFIWAGNEPPRRVYDGHIRDLALRNMEIRAVASSFIGSEKPGEITGVTMKNITMHVSDLPEIPPVEDFSTMPNLWGDWWKCGGLRLHNAPGVSLENCRITCGQPNFSAIEQSESKKK